MSRQARVSPTINSIPIARVACRSKNGGRNSQPEIHHGISPATTLGTATKKTAEPNMAIGIDSSPCENQATNHADEFMIEP